MRYFSKYLLPFATVVFALCSVGIVNAQTIEFGLGDRSGKAWGIGTERNNFIIIKSSASVPGFATQENVNAFAGSDLSKPLQLRLTVVHNNENPLVQILIKTPGHSAKYFADISAHTGTGLSSTPTVLTTTALGSPAEGSLGDLSAVEYIEVKGAWTSSTVRTHIRPRNLTAPLPTIELSTIEFGLGDRSGKAWGIGTERDNFIIIKSSASVPGFATQENVNAFAGADLSEPLQLRLTVVHNNANPLVQIVIKTPGQSAKYFSDISAHTGTGSSSTQTVSTTTALGSPAEGSLGDLSAVEYIEVKGAWTSSTVRTHIRPRELTAIIGSGGDGDPESGALPVNTHAGQPEPEDGLGMDFNYLARTRSENLPFEWEVTEATQFNNRYSFFAHDPQPANNDDRLTVQTGNSPNEGNNRTNSHTAGSDILGDFRIKCQWSHFAYDDPIVFSSPDPHSDFAPGENKAHLHMFWGNTTVNWETNLIDKGDPNHIAATGGSSCNGGALNRSSYWMPALMHNDDHVMTPRTILVYYKTWQTDNISTEVQHDPEDTNRMPQGLQLIAGNGNLPDGSFTESVADAARNLNRRHETHGPSNTNENIYWACGDESGSNVKFNRIPTYDEWMEHCTGILNSEGNIVEHPMLNATVFFPQCMQNENELRSGSPHRWHVRDTVGPDKGCIRGSGFEHRIPRLGYLLYFDVKPMIDAETRGEMDFVIGNLRLSSDPTTYNTTIGGADVDDTSGVQKVRGGTLHADWVAAWHDKVQDMWLDHCVRDGANCSVGNLGTGISLREYPRDYPGQDGILDGPNDGVPDDYMYFVRSGSMIGDM